MSGEYTSGVYVNLPKHRSPQVFVKANPTFFDRVKWISAGSFLIFQAYFIVIKKMGGDLGGLYAWMAVVFGIITLTSALKPDFKWKFVLNKSITISILWIVIIGSLLLITISF